MTLSGFLDKLEIYLIYYYKDVEIIHILYNYIFL